MMEKTLQEMKMLGWTLIGSYRPSGVKGFPWTDCDPVEATQLSFCEVENFSAVDISVGKTRDTATILLKIAKKQKVESGFVNLANYMKKVLANYDVYPTSYGVGVCAVFNPNLNADKIRIEKVLNDLGLQFTTEYSDAFWVFRYRVSKSSQNIKILSEV